MQHKHNKMFEAAITVHKYIENNKKRKQNEKNLNDKSKLYSYLVSKRYNTLKYCNKL